MEDTVLKYNLDYQQTITNKAHLKQAENNFLLIGDDVKDMNALKQTSADEEAHPAVVASAIANVIYSNVADTEQIELLALEVTQHKS